ncbi:hypothetical protein B9G98_03370 [Wickerhamiella sorbophila]|uniref:SMP-LTD domain-containing protein n=1 Tax=Wickerhamiella sorbophila TaxID=45607 RepID=A0A2T0FL99_9ASCO|nr:hypothetical protein B9G98_03370 [Wickerhamiella sorbophila]PRT55750.1 hypothetical protein B9G98_03370 [Wickerhamiella sorbophila]
MFSHLLSFVLGGITIPLGALYLLANADFGSNDADNEVEETREVVTKWDRSPLLDFAKYGRGLTLVSTYVFLSETYIGDQESGEESTASPQPAAGSGSAQSSLKKLKTKQSRDDLKSTASSQPKVISKLPKYWAEVRDGHLHLYSTRNPEKRRQIKVIALCDYVVSLWPLGVEDFELFYSRMAVCLISRHSNDGLTSLDLNPGEVPRDALFFYVENPTVKEDLYFALLQESRTKETDFSLGPRDPLAMAQPLRATDEEWMELMNQVYTRSDSMQYMWLNAILGRLFLGVKDSKLVEQYWHDKIAEKLNRVNSSYFKEIIVKDVNCGKTMPYVTDVKLRSLTPDGELLLDFGIDYDGGFRVKIATQPDIQWLSNLLIEISVKLRQLKGRMVVRVKPPPSSRIWYAFESMPEMDLLIEPVVSQSRMNYSIVTKTMSKLLQDVVKETMVMPVMDDISFYDTSGEFYRGGIWDHRKRGTNHDWREGFKSEQKSPEQATHSRQSSTDSTRSDTRVTSAATSVDDEKQTVRNRWGFMKKPSKADTPSGPSIVEATPTLGVTAATVSAQQPTEPASAAMSIPQSGGIKPPLAVSSSPATASISTSAVTARPQSFEWSSGSPPGADSASSNVSIKSGMSVNASLPPLPPKKRTGAKLTSVAPESERFNQ